MEALLTAPPLLPCSMPPHVPGAAAPPCPAESRVQRTAYRPDAARTPTLCCRQDAGCARYLSTRSLVQGGRMRRT